VRGVVLVGFGGPRSLDEVEPMFARIFSGRVPPPVLEAGLQRYESIGGSSPLPRIADEIAAGLEGEMPVKVGMQFSAPLIDEAVEDLLTAGCDELIYLSLTPFHSDSAYFGPLERVRAAAGAIPVCAADPIGLQDRYAQACARRLEAALVDAPDPLVVFAAHSLPLDGSEDTERYDAEMRSAARGVMACFPGLPWTCVYTSRGARGGAWLGPDAADLHAGVARTVVVSPLGFATDHMEVLYDLDIKLREQVEARCLTYRRAQTLGSEDDAIAVYREAIEAL